MTLKATLSDDMKTCMREKDKRKLGVIRMALAAIKQVEVDERIKPDDARIIAIIDKMVKQRRESISQFEKGGREDLAEQENFEISVLQAYLPSQLSDEEIAGLIDEAIEASGASSIKEMGKVMSIVKPKAQGRADMRQVSEKIKARLA